MFKENISKPAIYRWINNVNGKSYVGSSVNLTNRLYKYYSAKHLIESKLPIVKAILKYGYSNFSLEILEYCTINNIIEKEQYYLDLLRPEYNILKIARSSLGFKHSEKTLELFRNRIVSEETKELLSKAAIGRTLTEEDKEKISKARKGIQLSIETRSKISKSTTNLIGIPVKVKNVKTGEELEYTNLTEAGEALNVSRTAIKKALDTGRHLKKKYIIIKK